MFSYNRNLKILVSFLSLEKDTDWGCLKPSLNSLCNVVQISWFILKQISFFIWWEISEWYHRTITRIRIACKKIPLEKSMELVWLWSTARLALNRNRDISRYQTTSLLKTLLLFFVCKKGWREDKSEFVTKSVGIIVTDIFM